jgi:hypothetical protein
MTLSPHASPFFSCSSQKTLCNREIFLCTAQSSLSKFDFSLLCKILCEWESSLLLSKLLKQWELYKCDDTSSVLNSLQIVSFNVRGFELRQQEVLLLSNSFKFDIIILLETGFFDLSFCSQLFSKHKVYYQRGENSNGGVVVMIREDLNCKRIDFDLPNVCVVDIIVGVKEEPLRVIGVYAPESRSWTWQDLSVCVSSKCVLCGDFNVDLDQDKVKAEILLNWSDSQSLCPYIPECPTSLRSDRIIDYVFTSGFSVSIQTYEKNTTSDHKPVMVNIPINSTEAVMARNIHWKVFHLFCEYVYPFWETRWDLTHLNDVYNDYTSFLSLLISRCTVLFPIDKYRIAIPGELRSYMSLTRALSFRQKRTGDLILRNVVKIRRKVAKKELKLFLLNYVSLSLAERNTSTPRAMAFWSRTKRCMKSASSSLHGFLLVNGTVVKDGERMCDEAANYYEEFFRESEVIRPHPYTDSPDIQWDNYDEEIPPCTIEEVINVVSSRKKKK